MLKRRQLGRSGLMVSEFCFGALPLGHPTNLSLQNSAKLMRQAFELGINFSIMLKCAALPLARPSKELTVTRWYCDEEHGLDYKAMQALSSSHYADEAGLH